MFKQPLNMPFVNMTPHAINLFVTNEEGIENEIKITPSGETIRLNENWTEIKIVDGVPITECSYTTDVKLPPVIDGLFYIVSAMVANAFKSRNDFLIPAQTLRNEENRIYGCTSLAIVN